MGFRGEALASIAAVAQVELQTRMATDEIGTQLSISGSKVISQEPVSCPVGSSFKVENLFFNVPARRKFLKTNATELSNILTAFERIVLVYPDIHFTLYSNGAELMNLRAGSIRQRITDVLGKQAGQELLPVEVDTAICRVSGFVGKPEAARKKGGCDYFFVNGRYMRHPYFHKAVISAYERLIPEGMQVPYFLYFDISPSDIDVNIHPTKTEIKFENEQAIWQILMAAVRDAIGKFCEVPSIDFDTVGRPEIPVFDPFRDKIQSPRVQYNPDYNPFSNSHSHSDDHRVPNAPDLFAAAPATPAADIIEEKSPAHYQYKGRYIMTAVKSGLMIIDQHRASIRVLYERYLNQQTAKVVSTQKLLFPETVQFPASDAVNFSAMMPILSDFGFDLSDLGGNTFAINGVPAGIEGVDPVQLLNQMVAPDESSLNTNITSLHSRLALVLARNAAVPYGQVLGNEEMENLVNELFACSNVNYTPDGKAVLCIFPQVDIERLLG